MSSSSRVLAPIVADAVHAAFGEHFRDEDPVLRPSQFADVQANAALALAKRVGLAPRAAAARVAEHLDLGGICSSAKVSGPGFINFVLEDAWIADQAGAMAVDGRLGVPLLPAECIPVDYSAPNVAKEMHVGHLRTTVVGDALVRVLEHLGHRVVRQNHIGDWGTPFGMLIEHLLDVGDDTPTRAWLPPTPTPSTKQRATSSTPTNPSQPEPVRAWWRCRPATRPPARFGASWWSCPSATSTTSTDGWA